MMAAPHPDAESVDVELKVESGLAEEENRI